MLTSSVAAANPLVPNTTILNLNHGGIVTADSGGRAWANAPNGVITVGTGGGVIAASTTGFFQMENAMNLGTNILTVGSDLNLDGELKHGEVRLAARVDAAPGAKIAVIPDVALRLVGPNILDDDLRVTLGADSLLLVDNAETVDRITGAASSRILGAAPLTLANADGGDFTLDSRIEGGASFSLVKQGGGTLTLTHPASSFSGPVTVSGGRLTVNGSLTQTSSVLVDGPGARFGVNGSINPGATTVVANGTVSGTGSLGPVVTSAATTSARVAPGNSIGILTVNGTATTPGLDLSSGSGAVLSIEVGKAIAGNTLLGPGVDYDQIVVNGHSGTLNRIVLGFDATLEIAFPAGRFLDVGDIFFIAVNVANEEPVSGTFASLAEGATVLAADGTPFTVTYRADWEGTQAASRSVGGNDVALIAVPESNAAAFALAGAVWLLARRRRRTADELPRAW